MKCFVIVSLLFGTAAGLSAQAMIEHAAAAATGGAIGGVAGKKVSDGINVIMGKAENQTKAAAKENQKAKPKDPNAPLVEVGTPQEVSRTATPPAGPVAGSAAASSSPASAPAPRGTAAPARRIARNTSHARSLTTPIGPVPEPLPNGANADPDAPTLTSASSPAGQATPTSGTISSIAAQATMGVKTPAPLLTREMLAAIAVGTSREEVLARLGSPTSRITMYEEEGALEVLRFSGGRDSLGAVRLINGKVAEVVLN